MKPKRFSFFNTKHRTARYILCYTLLFLLCAALCFGCFALAGKSMAWSGSEGHQDGISQHYIALSYWGDYLRDIARTLLTQGKLSIPTFDTTIGLGGDVIQTLSYYVIGDPLTLLSTLVPRAYTEYLYNFLIIFRLYLAGLAFSAFALHLKKNNYFFTLIGAMVYIFSSYATHYGVRHPYFLNPLIYLPLILLGSEYIFKKRKPWLFILSVMLAAVSNFYFFYMIAILTVVYVLVRMFDYLPKKNFKSIVLQLMPFAGYAIVGVLMGCVLFYPSVMTMLSSNRTSADSAVPLFYSLKNYINFPFAFSTSSALSGETLIGHLPLASLAILLLWRRRGERTVKILLAVCLLFLLFPVFGWLLNGMAYVTSRWTWAFSLLIGMICALYLPDLAKLSSSALLGQLSVISVFCVLGLLVQRNSDEQFTGMLNLLLVFVLPALVYVIFANRRHFQVILKSAVLLTTVICVAGMGYSRFLANDFVLSFVDSGTCLDNIRSAQGNALNTLEDQSFYRFEDYTEDARSVPRNATLLNGGNSTNCFFSLSSPTWYELLHSLGYRHPLEQDVQGTDNRTVVGMLANVKYFTGEQSKQNRFLPYGYSEEPIMSHWLRNSELNKPKPKEDTAESLLYGYYQNDLALPFGYTYDSYISRREYDALSYNEKQTALLHAAVLEEDSTLLPKAELPEGTDHKVDFTVEYSKDLSKQGNQYIATKNNQWMTIKLNNALPDRETYLTMYQASFMQEDPYVQAENNGKLAQMKPEEVDKLKQTSYNFKQRDNVLLTARMNDATKNIRFYSSASAYYTDARDVCTNLGYLEQTPTEIRVRFNTAGIYTIEALEVTQLDLSACEQRAREMSAEHLKNVVFSDNLITGDITVSDNKLLCLSLPYSIGWTAYVDGKKTDIRQTDLAFMGIELAAGTHQIELRYHTPYLKGGIILSIAGFAIFLILWLYHNRKFRIWFADKLDRLCSAERYAKH